MWQHCVVGCFIRMFHLVPWTCLKSSDRIIIPLHSFVIEKLGLVQCQRRLMSEVGMARTLFQMHMECAVNKSRLFILFDQDFSVFKAHHLNSSLCAEPKLNISLMLLKATRIAVEFNWELH